MSFSVVFTRSKSTGKNKNSVRYSHNEILRRANTSQVILISNNIPVLYEQEQGQT